MSSRAAYETNAQSEFTRVQPRLTALAARAQHGAGPVRAESERLLQDAQSTHDEALHRFELLKRAGGPSWDSLKITFETAWAEFRHTLGSPG